MNRKPKIIAITGPSATGKSKLAVDAAKKFGGEIISADSRYVYKDINIAAAKPTKEEMQGIPHYLIDICSLNDEYSAGRFVKDADKLIHQITNSKKIPIVTGGTGLYFRSLRGTFDIPEVLPDYEFRKYADSVPNEVLYEELKKLSPAAAEKIHFNNKVKIVRALEIAKADVKPASKECPYDILWICLNAKDRQFLYDRANLRVDKMFENGLLEEAKYLFDTYGKKPVLLNTIGVKELYGVIYHNGDINAAAEEIKKNTRHYIKRQISWFNTEKDINYFYIDNDGWKNEIFSLINNFLS